MLGPCSPLLDPHPFRLSLISRALSPCAGVLCTKATTCRQAHDLGIISSERSPCYLDSVSPSGLIHLVCKFHVKYRCLHCYHVCKIPRLRPLSHRAEDGVRTFSPALWLSGRSLGILHTHLHHGNVGVEASCCRLRACKTALHATLHGNIGPSQMIREGVPFAKHGFAF